MKNIIAIFVILSWSNFVKAQAPNWLWAKSAGGTQLDQGLGVTTDINGNVYVTGSFYSQTITFGTTTLANTGVNNFDIFIVKYDAIGNVLWAKTTGSTSSETGLSITTDASGNLYLTGYFVGSTISFGTSILTCSGGQDIFIAKYDSNGNVIWAKGIGGNSFDMGLGISTDAIGNVFVSGTFQSPAITFGITTILNTGNLDIFIAKYDSSGNVLWAKSAGTLGNDYSFCVKTDANGDVFMTGSFYGTSITFGTTTLTSSNIEDVYIVKYDSNGNVIWAKGAGGTYQDIGSGISTDAYGNVYMTGSFYSPTITFGTTTLTNLGSRDIFIVKYDSNGNVIWANSAGGTSDDLGHSITTDVNGNLFISGYFASTTINFGATTLASVGSGDIFIVKCDSSGSVLWAKNAGGNAFDQVDMVTTDVNGNIYITGFFNSPTIAFGANTLNNAGSYDFFLAKLAAVTVGLEEFSTHPYILIAPNPFTSQSTITFDEEQKNTTIKISDALGKEIKSTSFSGKKFMIEKETMKAGIYFIQSIDQNKNVTNKKIIVQ